MMISRGLKFRLVDNKAAASPLPSKVFTKAQLIGLNNIKLIQRKPLHFTI